MKSDEKKRGESARKNVKTKKAKSKGVSGYYDGHYPDTDYTLEEIEEQLKILKEESDALTEWLEV